MDSNKFNLGILKLQLSSKINPTIRVSGSSMYPTLFNGDQITIERRDEYAIGDILVFIYKKQELLVHRLIRKEKGIYYCKGDNAFRLENIAFEKIIGVVILKNNKPINKWSSTLIDLSYSVNRMFVEKRYDVEAVKKTTVYKEYVSKLFAVITNS